MIKIIAPACLAAFALAGCNATSLGSDPAAREAALNAAVIAGRIVAPKQVDALDRSIAQVAASPTMASACAVFRVAAVYYATARPNVSAANMRRGDALTQAGADLCANPPADTAAALTTLNRLWAGVQASTVTR